MAPRHSSLTFDRSRRPCLTRKQQSNLYLWSDSGAGQSSGEIPESLRDRFPSKQRSIQNRERFPNRTPVCGGSDSLHTGAVPKTEHNEGAVQKTELKKVIAALLLVCWSVSLLFCRVSFLVGVLPLGPRLCLSAMGFRDAFFQRKGDDPRTDHFRQVLIYQARLCYDMAARLRSIGYATFCEGVPCAIRNSGRQVPLSSNGSCGLLFLKRMKATVFMCVAGSRRKDIPQVVLHSQWLQVTSIPKTGHAKQEPSLV